LASSVGSELRAHSGLRKIETWKSLRIMSDKASIFDTVRILSLALDVRHPDSEKAESVLELGPLEGAACFNCEVGLCAVPGSPIEGAKIIDAVKAHNISLILLKFLSL